MKKRLACALAVLILLASIAFSACTRQPDGGGTDTGGDGGNEPSVEETAGLSDVSALGIDSEKFDGEILYEVNRAEYDYIIFASDYGVKADDKTDDAAALQRAVDAAAKKEAEKTKLIVLPQGEIDIMECGTGTNYRYGIYLDGISNLTIAGEGEHATQITFFGTLGMFKGIYAGHCNNLKFYNLSIDWGTLPFVMAEATGCDVAARTVDVRINEGYEVDPQMQVIEYLEFNAKSALPRVNGNFRYIHNANVGIRNVEYLGGRDFRITFTDPITKTPEGTRVVLAQLMTMGETVFAEKCENLYFEHVYLYASSGMAIKVYTTENLYFNHFRAVCKPGTDRLMTSTADILHLKNCKGEIVITNSQFENSHDDAINIGGHFLRVKEIRTDGKVRLISQLGMTETFAPEVGDRYEFCDIDTMEILCTKTIKTSELGADGYVVTFEEGTDGLKIDNAAANASRVPSLVFRNNIIRNKRNRGLLLQTRNAVIENNLFSNVLDGPILMTVEVNNFHESISPADVVIRNNKFLDNSQNAPGDITAVAYGQNFSIGAAGVIHDIEIENNFFGYSKNASIALKGVSATDITHNYFYKPAAAYTVGDNNSAISLQNVSDISITYNVVEEGQDLSFKPVFINTGVDMNSVSIERNEGIDMNDILGRPEETTAAKIAEGTIDVSDGSVADWENVGTLIPINGVTDKDLNEIYEYAEDDFSAVMKICYSEAGLYFMYDVKDDELNFLAEESYFGDVAEIYLTLDTESYEETTTLRMFNDYTLQLRGRPESVGGMELVKERTSLYVQEHSDGIVLNTTVTEQGYIGEGFIPAEALSGFDKILKEGGKAAFTINLFDNDSGEKIVYYSTARHPVPTNMRTPAYMNVIRFGGNGQ